MKIFETNYNFGRKINFVDDNNVFVGFDWDQSCCEYFDWFFSREIPESLPVEIEKTKKINVDNFNFDTSLFLEWSDKKNDPSASFVTFKLTKEEEVIFLTLFNMHNGYYSHGFEFSLPDNNGVIHEGSL